MGISRNGIARNVARATDFGTRDVHGKTGRRGCFCDVHTIQCQIEFYHPKKKWFVLTFCNNRAKINEKKGGDGGIDGVAYVLDVNNKDKQENHKVLFSVKSDKVVHPDKVRELNGTLERDGAVAGYLLTLYAFDNLVKESKKYGTYRNNLYGKDFPKIQVVSVEEMLNGARLDLPTVLGVLKSAQKKGKATKQEKLL